MRQAIISKVHFLSASFRTNILNRQDPNTAQFVDDCIHNGRPYLLMSLMHDYLQNRGIINDFLENTNYGTLEYSQFQQSMLETSSLLVHLEKEYYSAVEGYEVTAGPNQNEMDTWADNIERLLIEGGERQREEFFPEYMRKEAELFLGGSAKLLESRESGAAQLFTHLREKYSFTRRQSENGTVQNEEQNRFTLLVFSGDSYARTSSSSKYTSFELPDKTYFIGIYMSSFDPKQPGDYEEKRRNYLGEYLNPILAKINVPECLRDDTYQQQIEEAVRPTEEEIERMGYFVFWRSLPLLHSIRDATYIVDDFGVNDKYGFTKRAGKWTKECERKVMNNLEFEFFFGL
ncbi:hypothetical protein QR680_006935 [Steinernema hermaphroditum]|uniref:Uncharacterized protein n=1 Tax=Steinernema hermaphroditum TaxID=289476 RepID=A0AA39HYG7_9BILA|nr:hypothetical protein QR680_006935 [Steinernema hermaphroditum]